MGVGGQGPGHHADESSTQLDPDLRIRNVNFRCMVLDDVPYQNAVPTAVGSTLSDLLGLQLVDIALRDEVKVKADTANHDGGSWFVEKSGSNYGRHRSSKSRFALLWRGPKS
jgi:hypothetical protein